MDDWQTRAPVAVTPPLSAYLRGFGGRKTAFLHAPADGRRAIAGGVHEFFRRLVPTLDRLGFEVGFSGVHPGAPLGPPGRHLHINVGRRWPGMERQRLIHAHFGYLPGFWYFDPKGYRWSSSIGDLKFDARAIDGDVAQAFFRTLRERYVWSGQSFHAQPEKAGAALSEGYILILLQSSPRPLRVGAHMTEVDMIAALIAARDGRPVLIKRHPKARLAETEAYLARIEDPARGIMTVEGNLHDYLKDAAAVACISSGAGFEALLHRKPVLLFGTSDYHHCAETVRHRDEAPEALTRALAHKKPHSRYVWWFFQQSCIAVDSPDFEARIARQLAGWL